MDKKLNSRREFIANAAALGIAGAIGTAGLLSSCKTGKTKYELPVLPVKVPDGPPLKVGIIGCGGRGTNAAIKFVDAGPNLEIGALGDIFQHRIDNCRLNLKEIKGIEIPDNKCFLGFDAYKRVMDSDVDVIILATPAHFRPIHLEAAVQARKHSYIEKPVAVDPVGVRSVMASGKMAESAGLTIIEGTQFRYGDDWRQTFGMVKNGTIGDLISGNAYRIQGRMWHVNRQPGWSDMEAMLRDWTNWRWISGDSILELHFHRIDVLNWFFEKYPQKAIGFGGRHRRLTGDCYDFMSVDFTFDDERHFHSMSRQIDGCDGKYGTIIYGTKGYTNCQNKIYDYDHNLIWEYKYPLDEDGRPTNRVAIHGQDQVTICLVDAIRTNKPINQAQSIASSNLVGIMGRESAYTGKFVTWDEMMNSNLKLGPEEYRMGPVDIKPEPPVPGTAPDVHH